MNRLQKKCIIASGGIHLLLATMLIFGPGFLSSHSKDNSPPILTFVAIKTTDDNVSGGGDNTVKAPPAQGTDLQPPATPNPIVTPQVQVAQPPVVERTPTPPQRIERTPTPVVKETPRVDDTPKFDPAPKPGPRKPREIDVSTKLVTSSTSETKAKHDAEAKAAAAAAAAKQKRIAAAFKSATTGIRGGVAGSTEIRLAGPGGGGVPYANFLSAVQTVYYNAWRQPGSAPEVAARVSVSIARDGTVISAHIISPSGNSVVDRSVQETIDRVKFAAPLPDSSTEESRDVIINFKIQPQDAG